MILLPFLGIELEIYILKMHRVASPRPVLQKGPMKAALDLNLGILGARLCHAPAAMCEGSDGLQGPIVLLWVVLHSEPSDNLAVVEVSTPPSSV